jgi:hypothetical protein
MKHLISNQKQFIALSMGDHVRSCDESADNNKAESKETVLTSPPSLRSRFFLEILDVATGEFIFAERAKERFAPIYSYV